MWNAAFRGLQRIHTTLLMQQFFRYLIDMRNCLTLAKSLYWPLEAAPLFLDGGTLATALYEKAHRENDLSLIVSRLRIKAQADEVDTLHGLEKALQRTLSRTLKNWSRHGRTYASILYYLWEQYRYARNIGLVYFTSQMEPEAISEGLAG
jgi:vacuolar-type H+-ATPase subunit C/Vma6